MNENKEVIEIEVIEHQNRLNLKKPIMIDGEEVSYIDYDTDKLTGASIEKAVQELQRRQIVVVTPELDTIFHAQLFSIASGLDYTDMQRLPMKDYVKATGIIRDFFID